MPLYISNNVGNFVFLALSHFFRSKLMTSNSVVPFKLEHDSNEYCIDRDGHLVIATASKHSPICDALISGSVYKPANYLLLSKLLVTGGFLRLSEHAGDKSGADKIASIITENNTVALASALLLTIQFVQLFMHNDNDVDKVGVFWGNVNNVSYINITVVSDSGDAAVVTRLKHWGDVLEAISFPYQFFCICTQCLALLYAMYVRLTYICVDTIYICVDIMS